MLRTLVVGARDLGPALSASAGLQAVALAIHLEDMDMVGEPVEQRAREALRTEDAGPFVKGQVAGHQHRTPLVTSAEDLEQQFRPGGRQRYVAELIDDQQLVASQLLL